MIVTDRNPISIAHHDLLKKIIKKYPQSFDSDSQFELDRLIAIPPSELKKNRRSQHILKIAYSQYFIQRELIKSSKLFRKKRHLKIRIFREKLQYPLGVKSVLGIVIGICLKEKYESLDESHVLRSILRYVSNASTVRRSFYSHHDSYENIKLIYMEVEKIEGTTFTTDEVNLLKSVLPQELERRVEKLSPSLFFTHNEEELIKNILVLGKELKYIKDIPQAMIFFEDQLESDLIFSVIITRVLRKGMEKWNHTSPSKFGEKIKCLENRSQIIGYLRKSYPKEAIILRLQIPKEEAFIRTDSSIDLFLAREQVVFIIEKILGEFRDYNGGIILKRREHISQLKKNFKKETESYPDFLENIFYSIIPMEMQVVSSLQTLQVLMGLFFEGLNYTLSKAEEYFLKVEDQENRLFILVHAGDPSLKTYLKKFLEDAHNISKSSLIFAEANFQGISHFACIYQDSCIKKRQKCLQEIKKGIKKWQSTIRNTQILKLSCLHFPISLDPRIGGDEVSVNIVRMLFEGLMRIGADGSPHYGIAESVTLSKDLKQYTFVLRNSYWSNGTKLTAYDFESTWKKILSPNFNTAFTSLFYPIQNAHLAKRGLLSTNEIGVKAIDERILKVDLEAPTPYFLELTAHPLYSPVNQIIDATHPDWSYFEGKSFVCNGPFRVKKINPAHSYEFMKNENYWDKDQVHLEEIFIFKASPYVALERYLKKEIDWLGRPLSPWEPFFSKQSNHQSYPTESIYWFICNTTRFPFHHIKVRQALSYAINREKIIQALSYDGLPATTSLPLSHTFNLQTDIIGTDQEIAQHLFHEALHELNIKKEQFPPFTLIHINRGIKQKVAQLIQKQWQETLGITCKIEGHEWKTLFAKMEQGNFDIGAMGWVATIDHPLYILDIFKSKQNPLNFSNWESPYYFYLLNEAIQQDSTSIYQSNLAKAEGILLEELPIIPIFYEKGRYAKQSHLKEMYLSKVGNIDFKNAYISH